MTLTEIDRAGEGLRCAAFRSVRSQLERLGDRSGLRALDQLFKRHQRKCKDCRDDLQA